MNTTAHIGRPAARSEAVSLTAGAGSSHQRGSTLRRLLKRVVAFVVPPDDKIAQTWRWLL